MLATLKGLDHVVVTVKNLAAAATQWQALGFTVSPQGTHSAHLGSGNHTIVFQEDYIELLGILTPTEHNAPARKFLEQRGESLERIAFTTTDAAAGLQALTQIGLNGTGPTHFSRPVQTPSGEVQEAAFSVFYWPLEHNPRGFRLFACQHHTPATVFMPSLQTHANTAQSITRVEVVSDHPEALAQHLTQLLQVEPVAEGKGFLFPTGKGRAAIEVQLPSEYQRRYALRQAPDVEGIFGVVLKVADVQQAAQASGASVSQFADGSPYVAIPPERANGVFIVFQP